MFDGHINGKADDDTEAFLRHLLSQRYADGFDLMYIRVNINRTH